MASSKITLPKGMRDFSPSEMEQRNYIFDTIKTVFEKYGFRQIETPAMELLSTLLGKYGDEGDKLLFRVLNSGDFLSEVENENKSYTSKELASLICEKGLKYDLTVPFARYVVQHRNDITFPFKRFQIQPVWRADRPQKGRYREFYQCDADIIGSNSLINEFEMLQMSDEIFGNLGIKITIMLNNRKILSGLAEISGIPEMLTDITVAIDKADKIGIEKAMDELKSKGINDNAINKIKSIITLQGNNTSKLNNLKEIFQSYPEALKGIEELECIFEYINNTKFINNNIFIDLSLARGLNYYTGTIIEIKAQDVKIGSICGGGRYDNLTGIFGLPGISGIGISFGADRIADVMNELKLMPEELNCSTKVMFVNFGRKEEKFCLKCLEQLRKNNITAEIYPDNVKIKKQMSYANARNIPYVIIAGENEIVEKEGRVILKNMLDGTEIKLSIEEIIEKLNS